MEADEEWKNHSANDLVAKNVNGETLTERFAHELVYFEETGGKHLDIVNWTLCAGSRDPGGCVPDVGWCNGKLHVNWCYPTHADGYLRVREAVS